jgi:hypothetical protein
MPSNIPTIRTTSYTKTKPDLKLSDGQRACFLTFKTDKETKVKPDSLAIILNRVTTHAMIQTTDKGGELMQSLLDDLQDFNAKRANEGAASFDIVEDAAKMCADYFDTSRTSSGTRVTKELVSKWFDANMATWLQGKVVAKFPQFTPDKVAAVVAQYRESFAMLASYQLPHSKPVYNMIQKAWNDLLASDVELSDSDTVEWIAERLTKLGNRHNAEEMLVDAI